MGDTMAADTVMVDTDTDTVVLAKDLLMPNLRLRLRLLPGEDTMVDTMAVPTDTDTDTDTVVLARGPLKPNPRPSPTTDTVDITAVDTMVDTVDTDMAVSDIMVELLKTPLKLPSGSSHSISFNLATIPSIF